MDSNSKREVIAATFDRLRRHLRMYETWSSIGAYLTDEQQALLDAKQVIRELECLLDDEINRL